MRTELIPVADVRIGDCLLGEQGALVVVNRPAGKASAGAPCESRWPIIQIAESPVVETWR